MNDGLVAVETGRAPVARTAVYGFFDGYVPMQAVKIAFNLAPAPDAVSDDPLMRLLETELRARKYSPRTVKTYLYFVRDLEVIHKV